MTKSRSSDRQEGQSQTERFIETARALGADEDETAFKEKLARIARQRPVGEKKTGPAKHEVGDK